MFSKLLSILKLSQIRVEEGVRRIIHSNNSIKINTKGISKEKKERLLGYLKAIEELLK